ncbi:acyl-CoA thioesterase [Chloroflexota bacterium]
MARIKISLPSEFLFSTDIPIRIGDINRGMHLGHESFLVIIEEARARFLHNFGYTESDINGVGLIMMDASIVYLKQAHYGQTLKVDIAVNDFTTRGFDMVYRVSDAETGVEIARAKTSFLLYSYQLQKVTTIPQDFKKKFSN